MVRGPPLREGFTQHSQRKLLIGSSFETLQLLCGKVAKCAEALHVGGVQPSHGANRGPARVGWYVVERDKVDVPAGKPSGRW